MHDEGDLVAAETDEASVELRGAIPPDRKVGLVWLDVHGLQTGTGRVRSVIIYGPHGVGDTSG